MMTFIPSVFPKIENVFDEIKGVSVCENESDFKLGLYNKILEYNNNNRPVLVFFENKQKLDLFREYLDIH